MLPKNNYLADAKKAKKDEFYTKWENIESEMRFYLDHNPNVFLGKTLLLPCDDPEWSTFTKYFVFHFKELGLKKLISTSYAPHPQVCPDTKQIALFDVTQEEVPPHLTRGRIFTVDETTYNDEVKENALNMNLTWELLEGDGDFRSEEVTKLRDSVDMVITNPPFSLFREFMTWVSESSTVQYSVIGNMTAISSPEIFSLFQAGECWYGPSISDGDTEFQVPDTYPLNNNVSCRVDEHGIKYIKVRGVRWFTNIAHSAPPKTLPLLTMAENLEQNRKIIDNPNSYKKYDNYQAIEVPVRNGIPSDYTGAMGVPISFMDRYNPEQFELLGLDRKRKNGEYSDLLIPGCRGSSRRGARIDGEVLFCRIFIKNRKITTPDEPTV